MKRWVWLNLIVWGMVLLFAVSFVAWVVFWIHWGNKIMAFLAPEQRWVIETVGNPAYENFIRLNALWFALFVCASVTLAFRCARIMGKRRIFSCVMGILVSSTSFAVAWHCAVKIDLQRQIEWADEMDKHMFGIVPNIKSALPFHQLITHVAWAYPTLFILIALVILEIFFTLRRINLLKGP